MPPRLHSSSRPSLDGFGYSNTVDEQAETPLGYAYSLEATTPLVAIVPVLRSGLGMLEGRLFPILYEIRPHRDLSASEPAPGAGSGPSSRSLPRT